jgi:copper chaperone CopZ
VTRTSATFEIPGSAESAVRCLGCAERVCQALQEVPGVMRVECDPSGGAVRVDYDDERITEGELSEDLDRFGYDLSSAVRHAAWRIMGLD